MRVIFLPDGGFQGLGGFIEVEDGQEPTGKEEVYQRQGHLRFSLRCHDLALRFGHNVIIDQDEKPPEARTTLRGLTAKGEIQDSRWMRHRFSILGNSSEHSMLDVNIREHETHEGAYVAAMPGVSDLDLQIDEGFFVEVVLSRQRMDRLLEEVRQPGAELRLEVNLSAFPRFYATWSPAIDEGRLIKFLDSDRDVENADEIPDDFWNEDVIKENGQDDLTPPVSVWVLRSLPGAAPPVEDEEGYFDEPAPPAPPQSAAPAQPGPVNVTVDGKGAGRISRAIYVLAGTIIIAAILIAG